MFKFRINNILSKNKLVCLFSLLLSTSIVYPLISCGSDGSTNDIGGFDKEFGFDAQTYNRLENEFINKYRNQLLNDDNIDKNIALNNYDNFLQNDLPMMRDQLFDPAKNYSFTVRTNALMDYASKNYNIYLNRNSNVSEIAFDNLKQSSLENFIIYLDNVYGIDDDEKDKQITNFSEKFNELLKKYQDDCLDNVQILLNLRGNIINCWANLNQEFAYLAAYNHLKDFFDDYQFMVRDQSKKQTDDNLLLWDNLLNNKNFITIEKKIGLIDQDINCPITDQWVNKLFTISKKKSINEDISLAQENDSSNQQVNSTSDTLDGYKQIENFDSQEIIPGYTLTPVLKTMTQDIYANNYFINIDWQLISNKYKDEKDQGIKDKVTAHIAYNKNEKMMGDDDSKKEKLSSNDYQFAKYDLIATPAYQKQNLIKAYFDNEKEKEQKITFSWDMQKIGIEHFLPSYAYDKDFVVPKTPYNLEIAEDNLSKFGLQLNGTNLSDLLDKQKKSQDDQTVNNGNNDDDLKIEEKFVKYCSIDAISNVTFYNNLITNNKIQNTFTATYNNTSQECEISNKQEEVELNNIGTSSTFNDNAVYFYTCVANYVDTQKIVSKIKISDATSNTVFKELIIASVFLVFILFLSIYINYASHIKTNVWDQVMIRKPFVTFVCLISFTLILFIFWWYSIYKPIHNQVDKVQKWNDEINNHSSTKIAIIKNIKNDLQFFSSCDSFKKYLNNKDFASKVFTQYFYYSQFYNLLQKIDKNTNSENDISKHVQDDYNEFNESRKANEVTIYDDRFKIITKILITINMIVVIFAFVFMLRDAYDLRLDTRWGNIMYGLVAGLRFDQDNGAGQNNIPNHN